MADKRRKHEFIVTVDIPEGVTVSEMAGYIERAVALWDGGEYESVGPPVPRHEVRVRHVQKTRAARKGG